MMRKNTRLISRAARALAASCIFVAILAHNVEAALTAPPAGKSSHQYIPLDDSR
jgi:hypothetical protein